MILEKDEDSANAALSLEAAVSALASELGMWVALKEDKAETAWDHLVRAQSAARTAMQAHDTISQLTNYVEHLHLLERILFPPQMFLSSGIVVEQAECSICGEEFGECDHIRGRAYMGRICTRNIKQAQLTEVSVVEKPANKLCRVSTITEDGVTRDFLTWRVAPTASAGSTDE